MPNAIKYNTSTETLALKKGNFWIGTGDVDKGPTSTTGYYNGISPASGGYTIYLNKATGGPSIYTAVNDAALISLTNRIANASYTTASQCLEYFSGQSDKICCNIDYPSVITNGLVYNVDAGFSPSYPQTNTTWYDLSTNGLDSSLINGASYNSGNGGNITNDGIDDYIQTPYMSVGTSRTVEIIYNLTSTAGDRGPVFRNDWYERVFPDIIVIINAGGTYYYLSGPTNDTSIQNICYSYGGTSVKTYKNGNLVSSQTMNGLMSDSTYYYNFGFQCAGSTCLYVPCRVYSVRMYNRQLSDTEVLQNFNATKSRFGL